MHLPVQQQRSLSLGVLGRSPVRLIATATATLISTSAWARAANRLLRLHERCCTVAPEQWLPAGHPARPGPGAGTDNTIGAALINAIAAALINPQDVVDRSD
jgi:hypothetical protein